MQRTSHTDRHLHARLAGSMNTCRELPFGAASRHQPPPTANRQPSPTNRQPPIATNRQPLKQKRFHDQEAESVPVIVRFLWRYEYPPPPLRTALLAHGQQRPCPRPARPRLDLCPHLDRLWSRGSSPAPPCPPGGSCPNPLFLANATAAAPPPPRPHLDTHRQPREFVRGDWSLCPVPYA